MAIPRLIAREADEASAFGSAGNHDFDIDEEEAALSERERSVASSEVGLEQDALRLREVHSSLLERIDRLDHTQSDQGLALIEDLPGPAPPLSTRDRKKAAAARRRALSARREALERRERTLAVMKDGLAALTTSLTECERKIEQLEKAERDYRESLEAAARETAAREEAGRDRQPETSSGAEEPRKESTSGEARRAGPPPEACKRSSPRARLDCEVDLGTDNNFYAGFAHNVSTGGLFVATFDLLPVGNEIDLSFSLPNSERITTRAVVRWIRDVNELAPEMWPGMGLEFQELSEEARGAIDSFVAEREPLFFPDA